VTHVPVHWSDCVCGRRNNYASCSKLLQEFRRGQVCSDSWHGLELIESAARKSHCTANVTTTCHDRFGHHIMPCSFKKSQSQRSYQAQSWCVDAGSRLVHNTGLWKILTSSTGHHGHNNAQRRHQWGQSQRHFVTHATLPHSCLYVNFRITLDIRTIVQKCA
jgi:hypothetical protein